MEDKKRGTELRKILLDGGEKELRTAAERKIAEEEEREWRAGYCSLAIYDLISGC